MKSRYTNVKYHCEISWYFSVHCLPQSLRNSKEWAKIKPAEKALAVPEQSQEIWPFVKKLRNLAVSFWTNFQKWMTKWQKWMQTAKSPLLSLCEGNPLVCVCIYSWWHNSWFTPAEYVYIHHINPFWIYNAHDDIIAIKPSRVCMCFMGYAE